MRMKERKREIRKGDRDTVSQKTAYFRDLRQAFSESNFRAKKYKLATHLRLWNAPIFQFSVFYSNQLNLMTEVYISLVFVNI